MTERDGKRWIRIMLVEKGNVGACDLKERWNLSFGRIIFDKVYKLIMK